MDDTRLQASQRLHLQWPVNFAVSSHLHYLSSSSSLHLTPELHHHLLLLRNVLHYASRCAYVDCINRFVNKSLQQAVPGEDLIMSNMYSLLNYIAATSKELYETSSSSQLMNNPLYPWSDHSTLQTLESGLRGLSEDEKRLVGISTISVVTRLALEFRTEEACQILMWVPMY